MTIRNPDGIWPTMITPYTENNEVDYEGLERLIDWYISHGVDGLFAVCQSSEMFFLSLEERVSIARFVKQKTNGRVPVIASGHISDDLEDQVKELTLIAETGVDAVILLTNRFAAEGESDNVWFSNLTKLVNRLPADIPLGFYECPYPYKRLITPELLTKCANMGRFQFLKDTCCDTASIEEKTKAIQGSGLKLYNANSATLLETLRLNIAGYSGVMANFHPELYGWLHKNWSGEPEKAERLSDFLSMASLIEKQLYPVNAKYYLMLEGVLNNYRCRSKNHNEFTATNRLEIEQLHRLSKQYSAEYGI